MTDLERLKRHLAEAHEWLMTNGRIPGDCGVHFYLNDGRGDITLGDQCRGIIIFSGEQDLWWILTSHPDFETSLRQYTRIVLAGPLTDSGGRRVMVPFSDLTRKVSRFGEVAIDPRRIADVLVDYLNRTAGVAHKDMKRYCAHPSDGWEPDHANDCGRKIVSCYMAIASVKKSPLWKPSK